MTTEEKAKAYDEALTKCKDYINDTRKRWSEEFSKATEEVFLEIFPQLAISDDKRIMEELIGALMWQRDCLDAKGPHDNNLILPGFTMEVGDILEWLEKQKENPKSSDSIPPDCTSDAKCEDRWHKVEDSLPDNGREVLAKDNMGNLLLARYDGEGWDVSVYDDEDYRCHNGVSKWCEIPPEKQKECLADNSKTSASEDEKIRKWIFDLVNNMSFENLTASERAKNEEWKKKILAYLEKQKVNTEGDFGRGYDCGYQAGYAVAVNEMKQKVATVTLDSEKQKEHQSCPAAPKEKSVGGDFYSSDKDKNLDEIAQDYVDGVKEYNPEPTCDLMQTAVCYGYHLSEEQFEKNRLANCDAVSKEECDRETDFAMEIIEKEHRHPTFNDAINYGMRLQKQKEQKPLTTEETELNSIAFLEQMGYTCIPPRNEQKPAQTAEEKEYVRTLKGLISDFIRDCGGCTIDTEYYQKICNWLDGRHIEQNPAESISQLTVQGKGVYKICPRCKERMIRDDSMVYTSMPSQYRYECPKCGEMEFDTVMYDNPENEEQKPVEWKPQPESLEALMYAIEGKWDAISPTSYLSRRLEDLYEGLVNTYNVDESLLAELPKAASRAYTAEDIDELRELKRKIEASMEQKPAEKQDYSGLNDLERAILRGFLSAGVENVTVTIIKETAKECLAQMKPAEWSEVELEFRGEKVKVKRPFFRDDKGRGYSTTEQDEEVAWNALRAWCEKKGISLYDLYPKVEWSEEDSLHLTNAILSAEKEWGNESCTAKWLKFLPERFNLQPKEEWSEEDENMYKAIIIALSLNSATSYLRSWGITLEDADSWLKSLSSCPKSSDNWKPSEEQMSMLLAVINDPNNAGAESCYMALKSIYNNLKKL